MSQESEGLPEALNPLCSLEERIDVNNLYLIRYNAGLVGLFEKKVYRGPVILYYNSYDEVEVYRGVDNQELVAVRETRYGIKDVDRWFKSGKLVEGIRELYGVVTTCKVNKCVPVDVVRLEMFNAGLLGSSLQIGSATAGELLDVLKYANTHYFNSKQKKSAISRVLRRKV